MCHPCKVFGTQRMLAVNIIISVSLTKGGNESFKNMSHETDSGFELKHHEIGLAVKETQVINGLENHLV